MKQIELLKNISAIGFVESYYNSFWMFDDEQILCYNFMYRNMLMLDTDDYALQRDGTFFLDGEIIKQLIEFQFLISDNFNELEYYMYNFYRSAYDDSRLTLLILPTLNCNLSCPYCYENKSDINISKEIEDDLLIWLRKNIENKKILTIDWFGGEPLLCFESIERLSVKIIKLCEEYNVYYEASMTTNGYLLTEDVIKKLNTLMIKTIQITFDGNKTEHNKQKFTYEKNGTFDIIMANVEKYCELSDNDRPLQIRINVSDSNYDSIPELLDSFSDNLKSNSFVFFRWLYPNQASGWKVYSREKIADSPYLGIYELLQLASKKGFHIENRCDKMPYHYCEADQPNYFTIDPRGYIYLCVHDYQPKDAIGNLKEGIYENYLSYFHKFRNVNPFNDSECQECKILPICNGGCRKARLNGKKECVEERQSVEAYIMNLYDKYSSITMLP